MMSAHETVQRRAILSIKITGAFDLLRGSLAHFWSGLPAMVVSTAHTSVAVIFHNHSTHRTHCARMGLCSDPPPTNDRFYDDRSS